MERVVTYRERLWLAWWWWLLALALAGTVGWTVSVAADPATALVAGALTFAAAGTAVAAAGATEVRVEVEDRVPVFAAGPARLELSAVTRGAVLDRAATALVRGPGYDPLAYHVVRGSARGAIRLDLADPGDPTPYWCVSTRHPRELLAAVAQARPPTRAPTPDARPPGGPPPG